jgi:hypothetical protein
MSQGWAMGDLVGVYRSEDFGLDHRPGMGLILGGDGAMSPGVPSGLSFRLHLGGGGETTN